MFILSYACRSYIVFKNRYEMSKVYEIKLQGPKRFDNKILRNGRGPKLKCVFLEEIKIKLRGVALYFYVSNNVTLGC